MKKVQFGRIINGELMYESGESDSTVFKGQHLARFIFTAI